jgi:hypothetical protein
MFIKLSILLMYLRLNPDRTFRRWTYAIGAFDVTYCLLSCGISALGCAPVEASWDFTKPHKCVNKLTYCTLMFPSSNHGRASADIPIVYAQANFNIVSDFATLLLPVRMCLKLRLPTRQRWMLALLFAVGSLYVALSPYYAF